MRRTTADRATSAARAMQLDQWRKELEAQRMLFENVIVMLDRHDYELSNYRAFATLCGKR